MISVGAAMLGAAGIGVLGALGSGYLGNRGAEKASAAQIAWERERAQNAHQWEVQDLEKAGLNPVLSAGGQGAVTGSIDAINKNEGYANALNNIGATAMTLAQMRLNLQQQKADIKNQTALTNAQVAQANANTARTLELLPEEIKNARWNRKSRFQKELGEEITNEIVNSAKTAGKVAGNWYGEHTTKQYDYKPKPVKPAKLIFRDNKHSYMY